MSTLSSVVVRDVFANRPAASIAGRLFFSSDTGQQQRDNGSSWDSILTTGGVSAKTADYTAVAGDNNTLLVMNSASAHTITLPATSPGAWWRIDIQNVGAGTLAVARNGLLIDTAASNLSLTTGQGLTVFTDGTNYFTMRGVGGAAGSTTGQLIGVQRFTSTGAYTYTPTVGTNSVIVELQGGGGGGAGVASPTGSNVNLGSGGSGGGWLRKRLTAAFSGATGVVGAKGNGGAAGANNGSAGSNTTFITTTPTTYTAGGGLGGTRNGAFAAPFIAGGVLGGTATGGDDNRPGGASRTAIAVSTNNNFGSGGGSSMYSAGAVDNALGGTNTSGAGVAADGNGGGGSGAVATGTGAAAAGGNGSDGVVIVWEFS